MVGPVLLIHPGDKTDLILAFSVFTDLRSSEWGGGGFSNKEMLSREYKVLVT